MNVPVRPAQHQGSVRIMMDDQAELRPKSLSPAPTRRPHQH